jgi:hypothetical protein
MPHFKIPNSASFHTAKTFFSGSDFFGGAEGDVAVLELHPRWMHVEPLALAMAAAWGKWCQRHHFRIEVENPSNVAAYASRMKLFETLGLPHRFPMAEHEEAGRFLPLVNVKNREDVRGVIADVSALLHLDHEPETLAAVQYCVSELLRNVLEHSGSPDGAFVCAHNYARSTIRRVTLAVADCGKGIAEHLGAVYPEALESDANALQLALKPGITGARPGPYGTPDNAGAGLFITRSIAKGTGGYFLLFSGRAAYRLLRASVEDQSQLYVDAFEERHNLWELPHPWHGTVVSVEIRTDRIGDFEGYFGWIREHVPRRLLTGRRIRFT